MRNLQTTEKYYQENKIVGAYETVALNSETEKNGEEKFIFEDTTLIRNQDIVTTERHMRIGDKRFIVCSIFPEVPKMTVTKKIQNIIEHDLAK
ncbi:MAG: hypothetical protein R3Y53_04185 [Bacillota bacterium]